MNVNRGQRPTLWHLLFVWRPRIAYPQIRGSLTCGVFEQDRVVISSKPGSFSNVASELSGVTGLEIEKVEEVPLEVFFERIGTGTKNPYVLDGC